jgi:putative ABC transport system permease protein
MESALQDLKQALRMFRGSPVFTMTAVAALALGIGANTAIFSLINTVLLSPVHYSNPDRVVLFATTTPEGPVYAASDPKFNLWRQQDSVLQDVSGYRYGIMNLTSGDSPEQIEFGQVTGSYFRLSGLPIAQGRAFNSDEERPGGARVAILTDSLRNRRFGGDAHLVGKTISLGGNPYEVIGIIAAGVQTEHSPTPDVWIPFPIDPNSTSQTHYFTVAGRLKPGVTLEAARSRLQVAAEEFRRKFPAALVMGPKGNFTVQPMLGAVVAEVRLSLMVLSGAVGFVLLIACTNVAHLLLVRAAGRKREIAIRAAIGASRGRIVRQMLIESLALFLAGGAFGLALGMVGIRALLALNPGNIPRIGEHGAAVTLDWRVAAFTLLVSLATGILFGLIPAVQASRFDLHLILKQSTGHSGGPFPLLVTGEIAMALILSVGAALLIRTYIAIRAVDPGFDHHHVLTMRMSLSDPRFDKTSGVADLVRDGVQRLKSLPGVEAAAAAKYTPMEVGSTLPFLVEGRALNGFGHWRNVSPAFFDVLKIPVVRGRPFTDRDDGGAAGVVIISQAMARQYWPNSDPLNERIVIAKGVGPAFDEPARRIVGIAGDTRDDGLDRNPVPTMYVPMAQVTNGLNALLVRGGPIAWIVRTRAEPYSLSNSIRNELIQASGGLPVASIRSMDEIVGRSSARQEFNMVVLTTFGCCALLLAAIGIYGLMAYSIERRTAEIGIRLALGARPGEVRNMIVFHGMRVALAGVAIGTVAALGLRRALTSLLFGIKADDPQVFILAAVLLGAVAFLSTWLAAARMSRIGPAIALRYE